MQEEVYRRFLADTLGAPSIASYVAYCRRVERELGIDLDTIDLGENALGALRLRLRANSVPMASLSNCMSALTAYSRMVATVSVSTTPILSVNVAPAIRAEIIRTSSTGRLLRLYAEILEELTERKVIRTGNSPVGDYAETLFKHAFGWELASNSATGYDATDQAGTRFQIKARRLQTPRASRQLSAIRNLDDNNFGYLAAVLFDRSFGVLRGAIIPRDIVADLAKPSLHTNSSIFMLEDRIWNLEGVKDVTPDLQAASRKFW